MVARLNGRGDMSNTVNLIEYYHIVSLAQSEDLGIERLSKVLKCDKMTAMRKLKYAEKNLSNKEELKGFKVYDKVMDMTFGQFLSIETMLSSPATQETKMFHVLTCIARPEDEKVFDNEDDSEIKEELLKQPFFKVLPLLEKFLENRHEFHFAQFKDVFYDSDSGKESVEEDEEPSEGGYSFERKWYWVQLLDMLSDESAHKWDDSLNMRMSTAAPYIAYRVSKAKKEWADAKRNEQEMKARSRR